LSKPNFGKYTQDDIIDEELFSTDLGMKNPTFKPKITDFLRLRISDLRKLGLLEAAQVTRFMQWGDLFGLTAITDPGNNGVTLVYQYGGEWRRVDIRLVKRTPTLGIGTMYYFECPATRHRCLYLYFVDGVWVSRFAIPGVLYPTQCQSRKFRTLTRLFEWPKRAPRRKVYYNGKLTRYGRVLYSREERHDRHLARYVQEDGFFFWNKKK